MKIDFPNLNKRFWTFIRQSHGQGATEYVLTCALIAFGAAAGNRGVATALSTGYDHITADFTNAFGPGSSGSGGGTGSGTPSGDPHGGDPHGGDPHGGDPHGGDPHGGDPHGGDPHGH